MLRRLSTSVNQDFRSTRGDGSAKSVGNPVHSSSGAPNHAAQDVRQRGAFFGCDPGAPRWSWTVAMRSVAVDARRPLRVDVFERGADSGLNRGSVTG